MSNNGTSNLYEFLFKGEKKKMAKQVHKSSVFSRSSKQRLTPLKITLMYSFVGGFLILFSDVLLEGLNKNAADFTYLQSFKCWFYVILTALILYIIMRRNMTALQQSQELAYYDALTSLPNRMLFNDRLSHVLSYTDYGGQKLAVILLDLDRLKNINDSLGHAIGDLLLQDVAERLKNCFHNEYSVFRLGGDEFAIINTNITHVMDVAKAAQKIINVLNQPFMPGGHELSITASIGISLYSSDGADRETLTQNAETAMYRAKKMGRNNYQFYTPEMNAEGAKQLSLESSLRKALEREEFLLHYQPQIDMSTGRIIGMETLIRWYHPKLGLISPADFIPLAEESGLIVPIGNWVLHSACEQNKAWQEAGFPPIIVSVNLSARQFQQKNLVETIASILTETGLEARWLKLEITESVVMHNVEETVAALHELKAIGVHIAIDDFGTGYSSLSYLKCFPIDTLKIDRSFVRDITTNSNDAVIALAVITLAHNLKLKVIAEGVETEEQLVYLRKYHCDQMQGYLFSRPVSAEQFKKLLEQDGKQSGGSVFNNSGSLC
jgi:diguanylate cyclase (GGDEF)-like protein